MVNGGLRLLYCLILKSHPIDMESIENCIFTVPIIYLSVENGKNKNLKDSATNLTVGALEK